MENIIRSLIFFIISSLLLAGVFPVAEDASAQQPTTQQRFDQAVKTLRAAMKDSKQAGIFYYHSAAAESEKWRAEWESAADRGQQAAAKIKSASVELLNGPDPNDDVVSIARTFQQELFGDYQYERAYEISRRLTELQPDQSDLQFNHARVAILTNRFKEAQSSLQLANTSFTNLPPMESALFRQLGSLAENFERELKLREAEAQADDLPRVELETTQGMIVIELFENQAPETVANFINLVEKEFYDDVFFHHVVKNMLDMSVAQAGAISRTGVRSVDYTIRDEYDLDDARNHFRGVVTMANVQGRPNTANCQILITFVPMPHLDGHHTVFGRILSDMKTIDALTATVTIDKEGKPTILKEIVADRIISARVLRKRDHPYEPTPIQ